MRKINALALMKMIQLPSNGPGKSGKLAIDDKEINRSFREILSSGQGEQQNRSEKIIKLLGKPQSELKRELQDMTGEEIISLFSSLISGKQQLRELMMREKMSPEEIENLKDNIAILRKLLQVKGDEAVQIPESDKTYKYLRDIIAGADNREQIKEILNYLQQNTGLLQENMKPGQDNIITKLPGWENGDELQPDDVVVDDQQQEVDIDGKDLIVDRELLQELKALLEKGTTDQQQIMTELRQIMNIPGQNIDGEINISEQEAEIIQEILSSVINNLQTGEPISWTEEQISDIKQLEVTTLEKLSQLLSEIKEILKAEQPQSKQLGSLLEQIEEEIQSAKQQVDTEKIKSKIDQAEARAENLKQESKNRNLQDALKYRSSPGSGESDQEKIPTRIMAESASSNQSNRLDGEIEKRQFIQTLIDKQSPAANDNKGDYRYMIPTGENNREDKVLDRDIETRLSATSSQNSNEKGEYYFRTTGLTDKGSSTEDFAREGNQNSNLQQNPGNRSGFNTINLNRTFSTLVQTESGVKTPVVNQITAQLNNGLQQSKNTITIQLKPENLGRVNVRLQVENGKVEAKFIVENQVVRSRLEHNLPVLRNNLVRQGLDVDHINIETEPRQQAEGDGGEPRQQHYQGENPGNKESDYNYQQEEFTPELTPEEMERIRREEPALYNVLKFNARYGFMPNYYQGLNLLA